MLVLVTPTCGALLRQVGTTSSALDALQRLIRSIRWNSPSLNVSITCSAEYLSRQEVDNVIWNLYFGPVKRGRLSEEQPGIEDALSIHWRHKKKKNV